MKKLFETLLPPSRLVLLVLGCAYAVLFAVLTLASMGDNFLEVMSNIIMFVVFFGAFASVPVLLLLNKDQAAKIVFAIVAGYLLLSAVQQQFMYASIVSGNSEGLIVAVGIFGFIIGLAYVAAGALLVLSLALNKENFKLYALLALVLGIVLQVIEFVLMLIMFIKYKSPWTSYLEAIAYLIIPAMALFGYLCFFGVPNADIKLEKQPVPQQEQPKEEKPVQPQEEEVPVEENPQVEEPQVDIPEDKPE